MEKIEVSPDISYFPLSVTLFPPCSLTFSLSFIPSLSLTLTISLFSLLSLTNTSSFPINLQLAVSSFPFLSLCNTCSLALLLPLFLFLSENLSLSYSSSLSSLSNTHFPFSSFSPSHALFFSLFLSLSLFIEPHENIRWEDVPKESIYSMSNGSNMGKIVKLFINMSGATGLGCRIASGPSNHPGIFIQFVKKGGLAEEAGLEVGDQIMHVNETSFLNVSHSQAVVALKGSKHLEVTIRKGIGISLTDSAANDSVSTNAPTAHTESTTSTSSYTNPVTPKEEDIVFSQLERRTERRMAPRPPTDQPTNVNGHFEETTPEASSYEEDASRQELENTMLIIQRKAQQQELYERMQKEEEKAAVEKERQKEVKGFQQDKAEVMRETILKTSSSIEDSQNENFVLKKQPAPLAPHVPNRQKNKCGSTCEDLTDMEARRLFSVDQIARRQIRLIKIRMNGPLGIEVEGGLNSPLDGRINVAAIFDGAAARQGGIHVGDQLMMADNIKLIDVSLIQAENVLDLAEKKTGELVKFIIAVAPPKYYEEEATYF
ncbi:USH1C [Acanthosepion pharaonis]|uniref:USH1C n=1 Tax=Acanthosepion pharaonis TaxID=158019 RepID=A0A812B0C2_ACAPH|nr:USH1C [Sepia pharaonis]